MRKLYLLSTTDFNGDKIYKIGFTKQPVESRVKQLQTGNYSEISIEFIYEADKYIASIESKLHSYFSEYRLGGEWFELEKNHIEDIPNLCEKYYNMYSSLESNMYLQDRGKNFK